MKWARRVSSALLACCAFLLLGSSWAWSAVPCPSPSPSPASSPLEPSPAPSPSDAPCESSTPLVVTLDGDSTAVLATGLALVVTLSAATLVVQLRR
jgi:hypothetical protein